MRGSRTARKRGRYVLGLMATAGLSACAAPDGSPAPAAAANPVASPVTAAPRTGVSIASMSGQYARPRPGPVAATGASAWVTPPPPPAFVSSSPLAPADPPAPPPAAVANRQPGAAEAPASDLVRPEAAAPDAAVPATPPGAAADPALRERGMALFNQFSCQACHAFADAGAAAGVGPSLDRNPNLTKEFVASTITEGRGAMPSFGGLMSDEEVAALTDYIVRFSRR